MGDSELDYCAKRAAEELEKAERAQLPEVQAAHRRLAEHYLQRVREIAAGANPMRDGS